MENLTPLTNLKSPNQATDENVELETVETSNPLNDNTIEDIFLIEEIDVEPAKKMMAMRC